MDKVVDIQLKKLDYGLVSIALGILIVCLCMFVGGFFKILSPIYVWILFGLGAFVFWRRSLQFVKGVFTKRLTSRKEISWLGYASFYLLLIYVSLNCLQNIRPIPLGFDALSVYMNLPKLIFQKETLIAGYSPYYWSLFNSVGYFLFNYFEVVLNLSISGGILAVLTLFQLSRRWLNIDYSMLVVLLFYTLPMVNFQSFRDAKIDLGLLFVLLCALIVLIEYIKIYYPSATNKLVIHHSSKKRSSNKSKTKAPPPKDFLFFIMLGILSGFALGTKLTSLIMIFALICIIFYLKAGIGGFLTSLSLTFYFILLAGLDVQSGLRAYHFGVQWFKWIPLLVGSLGFLYLSYKQTNSVIKIVRACAIYGGLVLLVYFPWPIKNYSETKTANFNTFISGKEASPNPIN